MEKNKVLSEKTLYDMKLRKDLEKKQFNTDLNKIDYDHVMDMLEQFGLSKALLIRLAISNLEAGNLRITRIDDVRYFLKGKKIKRDKIKELNVLFENIDEIKVELDDGFLYYYYSVDKKYCCITLEERVNYSDRKNVYLESAYYYVDVLNTLIFLIL